MILDGFGFRKDSEGNAVRLAGTPNIDALMKEYPNTLIGASGLSVGLPDGQMGNSEVGHLNIGAGRIVYQELTRITKAIEDGDFFENFLLFPDKVYCCLRIEGYQCQIALTENFVRKNFIDRSEQQSLFFDGIIFVIAVHCMAGVFLDCFCHGAAD